MDKNLLGKLQTTQNLLDSLLPKPQSAPPNIYGEYNILIAYQIIAVRQIACQIA